MWSKELLVRETANEKHDYQNSTTVMAQKKDKNINTQYSLVVPSYVHFIILIKKLFPQNILKSSLIIILTLI